MKERENKMLVGIVCNSCAIELKILFTAFLILCSVATVYQILPSHFSLSFSDLRLCLTPTSPTINSTISPIINSTTSPTINSTTSPIINSTISPIINSTTSPTINSTNDSLPNASDAKLDVEIKLTPPPPSVRPDEVLRSGIIKRAFNPYGTAAYNFILMSAYRGGLNTFAVIGLSSKPLHVFGKPTYECEWFSNSNSTNSSIATSAYKILPDWGYGRVYTVVVVNCTFPSPVGDDGSGGKLLIHASTNGGYDRNLSHINTFEALTEEPGSLNPSYFTAPPKYEYLYCGSPLYGNLSPQRVREWLVYHVRLFGGKSHFVIHDAGGVHPEVMEVLKPWMENGYVTLQDVKEQERFDGYYHNQFLIVNDCLHRYRFMAKWMFFFDVDEYIFVPKKNTLRSSLDSLSQFTQFTIEQMTMSSKLCLPEDAGVTYRKWGFEKLVFRDIKRGVRKDRKYAVQPRNVFATGVHMSQNTVGKTTHKTDGHIKYFHYHGTIADRREPCRQLVSNTSITFDGISYVKDTTLRDIAGSVKRFELKMIGSRLQRTRQ